MFRRTGGGGRLGRLSESAMPVVGGQADWWRRGGGRPVSATGGGSWWEPGRRARPTGDGRLVGGGRGGMGRCGWQAGDVGGCARPIRVRRLAVPARRQDAARQHRRAAPPPHPPPRGGGDDGQPRRRRQCRARPANAPAGRAGISVRLASAGKPPWRPRGRCAAPSCFETGGRRHRPPWGKDQPWRPSSGGGQQPG